MINDGHEGELRSEIANKTKPILIRTYRPSTPATPPTRPRRSPSRSEGPKQSLHFQWYMWSAVMVEESNPAGGRWPRSSPRTTRKKKNSALRFSPRHVDTDTGPHMSVSDQDLEHSCWRPGRRLTGGTPCGDPDRCQKSRATECSSHCIS